MYRSHNNGALRMEHAGQEICLSGWVQKVRDKGFMVWVDLRDRYGITQLIFDTERTDASLVEQARSLGREFVIQIKGTVIERVSLVNLFASILRREDDGDYYLVTPSEKWRIKVELHPLLVTDVDQVEEGDQTLLQITLNTGQQLLLGEDYPLSLEPSRAQVAVVALRHGLTALFNRAAWYRLVDLGEEAAGAVVVSSGDYQFRLSTTET